jgi:hypothetical protein
MTGTQVLKMYTNAVKPIVMPSGFRHSSKGTFEKAINDVIWYVVIYHLPKEQGYRFVLQVEYCVLSLPLLMATGSGEETKHWGYSQIRGSIGALLNGFPDHSSAIYLRNEQEAYESADEVARTTGARGLPFLARFSSTDDIIAAYKSGDLACTKHPNRLLYDIEIWEGRLEPREESFMDWRDRLGLKQ